MAGILLELMARLRSPWKWSDEDATRLCAFDGCVQSAERSQYTLLSNTIPKARDKAEAFLDDASPSRIHRDKQVLRIPLTPTCIIARRQS